MNLDAWAATYRHFARHECPEQPLYRALCQAIAADPDLLALNLQVPAKQARPNLLLAALHERLLAGQVHPLRDYYRSCGGQRVPDAELPKMLRDFALHPELQARLREHLGTRATQTNEPGRCALVRLALDALAAELGCTQFALFDFGSSAGLKLHVDADALHLNDSVRGPGQRLQLHCQWRGEVPPPPPMAWQISARLGVDLNPVNVHDPEQARWLQACVWPDDTERFSRLNEALAWAQAHPAPLCAHADGLALLPDWLAALPPGTQPVLLSSWVLAYLSPGERAAFHARALSLVREQGLAWVCGEDAAAHPEPHPPARPGQTLWSLHSAARGSRAWAWSHAHGTWAMAA